MKDFIDNLLRFPRFFITIILGIFFVFFGSFKPFLKNPLTATATITALVAAFAFLYFTLRAMLGLTTV